MNKVTFRNQVNEMPPTNAAFNNARRKNQQMLQELAAYRREVEAGTNSNNVKRITRKRNNQWNAATAKNRANELARNLNKTNGGKRSTKRSTKKRSIKRH